MFSLQINAVIILCILYTLHKGYCPPNQRPRYRKPSLEEINQRYFTCMIGIQQFFGDMKLYSKEKFDDTDVLSHAKFAISNYDYTTKMNEFAKEYYNSLFYKLKADSIRSIDNYCNGFAYADQTVCRLRLSSIFSSVKPSDEILKKVPYEVRAAVPKDLNIYNSVHTLGYVFFLLKKDQVVPAGSQYLNSYFNEILETVQLSNEEPSISIVFYPPNTLCYHIAKRCIMLPPPDKEASSSTDHVNTHQVSTELTLWHLK